MTVREQALEFIEENKRLYNVQVEYSFCVPVVAESIEDAEQIVEEQKDDIIGDYLDSANFFTSAVEVSPKSAISKQFGDELVYSSPNNLDITVKEFIELYKEYEASKTISKKELEKLGQENFLNSL